MTDTEIVIRLKNRRIELGISQAQLAAHCGFAHRSNISRLEAGKLEWKLRDMMTACELLKFEMTLWRKAANDRPPTKGE